MRLTNLLARATPAQPEPSPGSDVERRSAIAQLERIGAGDGSVDPVDNARWWGRDDERGLTTSAVVRRCVNTIAQPLASLEFVVENTAGEVVAHPFSETFNKGGIGQALSARVVKETAFARLELRGQAFLFMDRGPTGLGPVRTVAPIYRETRIVVDKDDNGLEVLAGFKTRKPGGGWVPLLPSEVLWLRYPDPDDPWGCVAPWTAALPAARLDRLAEGWQESELRGGNRASAVIYLGDLTPEQHDAATSLWNRTMVGRDSANRAFLTSGPTPPAVERLGLTAKEAAYLDTRQVNAEQVALAFGIDRDYLFGQSTFENKGAAKRQLWSDTLIPKLEVVASEADRQVVTEPGLSGGWDVSDVEALRESEDSAVTRLTSLLEADAITVDEARAERGMDPLPGGIGNMTLTAYRATVQSSPLAPAPLDPTATDGQAQRASRPRERVVVTRHGLRTRAVAPAPQRVALEQRRQARDETAIQRAYDRLEPRGVKAVARLADQMERSIIRSFEKEAKRSQGTPEQRVSIDAFFDPTFWRGKARDALETFMADVWEEGASRTSSFLGVDFTLYDRRVTAAMEARLGLLAERIVDGTRDVLESKVLTAAAEQGLSIDATVSLLRERFTDLRTWKAEQIARTETVGGFNASSRTVAVSSGVTTRRRWLAAKDDRVRDSHRAMDGHLTQSMDDPYPNGLMYPGDPSGSPSETVQCRCVETYEIEE